MHLVIRFMLESSLDRGRFDEPWVSPPSRRLWRVRCWSWLCRRGRAERRWSSGRESTRAMQDPDNPAFSSEVRCADADGRSCATSLRLGFSSANRSGIAEFSIVV